MFYLSIETTPLNLHFYDILLTKKEMLRKIFMNEDTIMPHKKHYNDISVDNLTIR